MQFWSAIPKLYKKMKNDLYLKRSIEEVITEASNYFSVITVTGPRQSGKSTLLKHLFPNVPKYSLKDVNVREFAENDPIAFLRQHPKGMFIDEVQKVPQLLEYIQGIEVMEASINGKPAEPQYNMDKNDK